MSNKPKTITLKMKSFQTIQRDYLELCKDHDKLLALLRKYEWLSDRYEADYCGTCHEDRSDGHTPDCALGNALKESG